MKILSYVYPAGWIRLAIPICVVISLGILGSVTPPQLSNIIVVILIKIVAVVGIYIFVGNSGIISLSHVAYMAIGAYVAAWTTLSPTIKRMTLPDLPSVLMNSSLDPLLGTLCAGGAAGFASLISGALIMRLSGLAASIATFAFLFMTYTIFSNWNTMTLGTRAIIGLATFVTPGVGGFVALLAICCASLFERSRFGLLLRSAREDELVARSMGVSPYQHKLMAYCISNFICGSAGALYGHYLGALQIDAFFLDLTFMLIVMLVVGGMTLLGAVVGPIFITVLAELFKLAEVNSAEGGFGLPAGGAELAIGLAILLLVIYRPHGLMYSPQHQQ